MDHYDEDQDIYISERSSIGSSDDETEIPSPLPPLIQRGQTPSPIMFYPQKQIYLQRFSQPEAMKNTILPTAQISFERKEEKVKKKHPKGPPAAGAAGGLATISENKPSDFGNHHQHQTSYGSYHRVKHPDRHARPRPLIDGPVKSYDSFDHAQGAAQAALVTSQIKPSQPSRQTRREGPTNLHDKQRFDTMGKSSPMNLVENEYQPTKISPRQSLANGNETDTGERRKGGVAAAQRRKGKATTNDWSDPHAQSFSNKSSQDSNSLIITSNPLISRSNNRSKIPEKSPGRNDFDENNKHRSHPNHSPSIPSPQNHHSYQHIRRRPPSGVHNTSELPSVDTSSKKTDRSSQMPMGRDIFNSPPPPPPSSMMVTNQMSYLPPISRENHYPKAHIARFPNEYYGTLARQAQNKDWEESIEVAKFYRPDASTRFYDRYLNVIPDKRLAAS